MVVAAVNLFSWEHQKSSTRLNIEITMCSSLHLYSLLSKEIIPMQFFNENGKLPYRRRKL